MGLKYVLVDIDRTLFPSLQFAKRARMAALRAMKGEGMRTGISRAYAVLMQVVKEKGPNYGNHFGEMMERLDEEGGARVIAAGVYAYNLVDAIFFAPSSTESRSTKRDSGRIEVNSTLVDRAPGIMLTKRF